MVRMDSRLRGNDGAGQARRPVLRYGKEEP